MTDPDASDSTSAKEDEPDMSNEEAAEVVENDTALQEAGSDNSPSSSDS